MSAQSESPASAPAAPAQDEEQEKPTITLDEAIAIESEHPQTYTFVMFLVLAETSADLRKVLKLYGGEMSDDFTKDRQPLRSVTCPLEVPYIHEDGTVCTTCKIREPVFGDEKDFVAKNTNGEAYSEEKACYLLTRQMVQLGEMTRWNFPAAIEKMPRRTFDGIRIIWTIFQKLIECEMEEKKRLGKSRAANKGGNLGGNLGGSQTPSKIKSTSSS